MEDTFHLGIKGIIQNSKGQILLLQVNPKQISSKINNYWDIPGGRVQINSNEKETLEREIYEETDIKHIKNIKPLGMVLSPIRIPVGSTTVGLILSVHTCQPKNKKYIIKISEEHMDFGWFSPNQAAKLLIHKYPKNFCQLIRKINKL